MSTLDDRLLRACNGMSASNGGMNLPEFRQTLKSLSPKDSQQIDSTFPRVALEELAKKILQGLQGSQASQGLQASQRSASIVQPIARPVIAQQVQPVRAITQSVIQSIIAQPVQPSKTIKYEPVKVKEGRLSARFYYDNYGKEKTIGDRCNIRKDGTYKCLLMTSGDSPRWESQTKNFEKQRPCENFSSRCKDPEYS